MTEAAQRELRFAPVVRAEGGQELVEACLRERLQSPVARHQQEALDGLAALPEPLDSTSWTLALQALEQGPAEVQVHAGPVLLRALEPAHVAGLYPLARERARGAVALWRACAIARDPERPLALRAPLLRSLLDAGLGARLVPVAASVAAERPRPREQRWNRCHFEVAAAEVLVRHTGPSEAWAALARLSASSWRAADALRERMEAASAPKLAARAPLLEAIAADEEHPARVRDDAARALRRVRGR